jgi:hypothetical protein
MNKIVSCFVVLSVAVCLSSPELLSAETKERLAFDKLRALNGDWQGTVAWTGQQPTDISPLSDQYGTDPTLRFKNTGININALTMISKRVERDVQIDVSTLLQQNREALSDAEKKFR